MKLTTPNSEGKNDWICTSTSPCTLVAFTGTDVPLFLSFDVGDYVAPTDSRQDVCAAVLCISFFNLFKGFSSVTCLLYVSYGNSSRLSARNNCLRN